MKQRILIGLGLAVLGVAATTYFTRSFWQPLLHSANPAANSDDHPALPAEERHVLKLSPQARANLGLVAKPVALRTYWKSIQVPGVIVDRPGQTDRSVAAPAIGIVAKVHAFPGDTVKPGDRLVTLRLISEFLQNSQSELFKVSREAKQVRDKKDRTTELITTGAATPASLVEIENQLQRLNASIQAHRQELLLRGLSPVHLDQIALGEFVSEIDVVAPPTAVLEGSLKGLTSVNAGLPVSKDSGLAYEVQELKADLGQQVQAGQSLCTLANHQALYIEGRGFKREAPLLAQTAQQGWPVRVDFPEDEGKGWPPMTQALPIRHLANAVDPASRTFAFYLPLTNQARSYEKDGRTYLVWRFRPGEHVRLHVPVEELKDVIVLPAAAVAREGPEAYVFVQNGDLFNRLPVRVLHEDRLEVAIAHDGRIIPGVDYVAHGAGASLNRVLKAQSSSGGLPPGAHFHADGSLHIPGK